MAFAWKFYNETDKETVEKFNRTVQNIVKNHEKLHEVKAVDLSDEDEKALEELMKKYKKKLEQALEVVSDFDQELEGLVKKVEEKK
ncbi:MAG: hypothetical protein IKG00_08340 [Lachnospiraceae bacterium]|nr:hypothetical protein [Lachnospiraceae bacterium]